MTGSAPLRAIVVGLGIHGQRTVALALDAGVEIAAAVDPGHAGARLAELVPGAPDGVVVHARLADTPAPADIALLCLRATTDDLLDLEEECVARGLNVATIVETAFDLDDLPPARRASLDAAAKAAGVTVVATGSQDVTWAGVIRHAAAQVRGLRSVSLTLRNGVDGYPRTFLDTLGVGLDPERFREEIGSADEGPSIAGATALVAARHLGLTPERVTRTHEPVTLDVPHPSTTYDEVIPTGRAVGDHDSTVIETREGITFTAVLESTAFAPGTRDGLFLHLEADPVIDIEQRVSVPPATVDATLVNRIRDVMDAPPGLVGALDLPAARYHHRAVRS